MEVTGSRERLRSAVAGARGAGRRIGLVPTMGAFHDGHLSLIRASAASPSFTVVSVFVNPLQFGPGEDYQRYPRDLENDTALAARAGADLLYAPEVADLYPSGFRTAVTVRDLSDRLCGATRRGHFEGVTTVVLKLLNIVGPDELHMGWKDAQQAIVVRRMIGDLDLPVELRVHPTVREPDGLAMSSRNAYLTPGERDWAPAIHRALEAAERRVLEGERDAAAIEVEVRRGLEGGPGRVEYVAVVDTVNLDPLARLSGEVLVATAVRLGGARLIDNVRVYAAPAPEAR